MRTIDPVYKHGDIELRHGDSFIYYGTGMCDVTVELRDGELWGIGPFTEHKLDTWFSALDFSHIEKYSDTDAKEFIAPTGEAGESDLDWQLLYNEIVDYYDRTENYHNQQIQNFTDLISHLKSLFTLQRK